MQPKNAAIAFVVAGILILLASLLADVIRFGGTLGVFGWVQLTGAVAGVLVALDGVVILICQMSKD
jgi:hypothetical protein